ncbi:MAG: GspH/FimT family protein [Gammaproteobacteria bacterium]|nr:GspH/FimT family protein [Gammaproteobacteria bacterium]
MLVVVGVLLTAAALSMRGDRAGDLLREEANRLVALTRLARDEAVLRGEELGLRVEPGRYAFLIHQRERWVPLDDVAVFRPRPIPDLLTLRLEVDGVEVSTQDVEERGRAGRLPHVVLWSSGEITPFVAVLTVTEDPTAEYSLVGSAAGTLTLRRLDENG